MSNPYHSRVQQKLAHCHLLLQLLPIDDPTGRQTLEALLQGAAVHLAVAARLYLREVGQYLSLRNPERIYQVDDLCDQAGEVSVVAEIRRQDWLTAVFAAEREVLNPQLVSPTGPQLITAGADNQARELTSARLAQWLAALTELTEQQRGLFAEY